MIYELREPIRTSKLCAFLRLAFSGDDAEIGFVAPYSDHKGGTLTFNTAGDNLSSCAVCILPEGCDVTAMEDNATIILSANPRLDFIRALGFLEREVGFSLHDFDSIIHPTVTLGQNVVIERGCVIDEGVVIEHNVVIHSGTRIGKYSRVRACAAIGGDGFGFERLSNGEPLRFPHLGGVSIGKHVEIGSCTAVAKGTLSDTIIEDHVKVDNLVHIAHGCVVKRGAFIIACAELSGGVVVGENAWVAPNSCTHQKVSIGDGAVVGLGAVVTKDVPARSVFAGNPAKKLRDLS